MVKKAAFDIINVGFIGMSENELHVYILNLRGFVIQTANAYGEARQSYAMEIGRKDRKIKELNERNARQLKMVEQLQTR